MKIQILASVASPVCAAFANTTETVMVKGWGDNDTVRVNKDEFDADQELPAKERRYELAKDQTGANAAGEEAPSGARSDVNRSNAEGVQTTAAPSAPDFTGDKSQPANVDPVKNAAAPTSTTVNQLLVMKQGSGKNTKFFISNGLGEKITGDHAKLLGVDENGYDTEEAAKEVQSTTEWKPAP